MSPKPFWHRGRKNKERFQRQLESRASRVESDRERARQHKHRAHRIFDLLWKEGHMTRSQAYNWLKTIFPDGIEHITEMDEADAEKLIRAVRRKIPVPQHLYY